MFKIRVAVSGDAKAIDDVREAAVFSKAINHYDMAILGEWVMPHEPNRVTRIEQEISNPDFIVLVAEVNGGIIGFAMAIPSKNELRAVYAKPNSIGRVGHALLVELEKRAFKTAEFLVCDSSLNAEEFYKKNGYIEESRKDHILPSGVPIACVVMKKHRP